MPTIRVRSLPVACTMGIVAFILVDISVGGQLIKYVAGHDYVHGLLPLTDTLFNVEREHNVTTLFSVFLLLCAAVLLTTITLIKIQRRDAERTRWAVLAGGFFCLAIDEAWSFHETLTEPMRSFLGSENLGIFFWFAWVIPALAGLLVLAAFFLGFLLRLPLTTRVSFLAAGALYLGGAMGLETVAGHYAQGHGLENLTYQLITHGEESLEMTGIIVFVYALLRYLADEAPAIEFLIS